MYPQEPEEQWEEATEPMALPKLPAERPTLAVAVAVEVIQVQEAVQVVAVAPAEKALTRSLLAVTLVAPAVQVLNR